jgi:type 1 fimbria pilin
MNSSPVVFLAALLLAPSAFAASSTDLVVQGSITPNACDPTISGGGVVDYGKMTAKDLSADQPTLLPRQTLQLSIQCNNPTLLAFNTIDNRAGSSAINQHWHGLGMTPDNEKLGSSGFGLYNAVADDQPARTLTSTDGGVTWMHSVFLGHSTLTAIGAAGTSQVPIAVTRFTADLSLYTVIDSADRLTVLDEIPLDGYATLQLIYL